MSHITNESEEEEIAYAQDIFEIIFKRLHKKDVHIWFAGES